MSRPSVAARLADDRHRPELKSPPGFTERKAENSSIYADILSGRESTDFRSWLPQADLPDSRFRRNTNVCSLRSNIRIPSETVNGTCS